MAQIFHRSTNLFSRVSIFGAVFIVAAILWLLLEIQRSSYVTEASVARSQPVPFSHKHHVQGMGIDCRYCHTSVEDSSFAGVPSTKTCMNCHAQIWSESPTLEPVRASFREDRSIEWIRVHDLADFVYFNHKIHVRKGFGCSTCHGQVEQMPLVWREKSLLMEWCLDCHRQPEQYVRARDQVFNVSYLPPSKERPVTWAGIEFTDQLMLGRQLVQDYNIRKLTSCSVCHR